MTCDGCNFYFSFGAILCPFTPLKTQKIKRKKKEKTSGDIIILHMCTKNYDVQFLRYGARGTDRQIDGRTDRKIDIWRWVSHLKKVNVYYFLMFPIFFIIFETQTFCWILFKKIPSIFHIFDGCFNQF